MMNILVVSSRPLEYNVSSSLRKINTIESLMDAGASITLLTSEQVGDKSKYTNQIDYSNIEKIEIPTNKSMYNSFANSKKRSYKKYKKYLRKLYYKFNYIDPLKGLDKQLGLIMERIEEKKYDIIISISDPKSSHTLANELIKNPSIIYDKYIQIWGDPLTYDITKKSFFPKTILKGFERKILDPADEIYYVSPLTLKKQKKSFFDQSDKMDVIYPIYTFQKNYLNSAKVENIGYFGDYNFNTRNIEPLYKAIKNTPYNLFIYGNSNKKLPSCKNITINSRVSKERVDLLEADMDLLIHLSNLKGTQIPGKIYQYLGTNKPILFILDGQEKDLKTFFSQFKRVYFCRNNQKDIIETINNINHDIKVEGKKFAAIPFFEKSHIASKLLGNEL